MGLFLIERSFAGGLNTTGQDAQHAKTVNDDGMSWSSLLLSAEEKKIYCPYEAEDAEAIRDAAGRNGPPADVVIAVSELRPEQLA
jgi:hypothetical protein